MCLAENMCALPGGTTALLIFPVVADAVYRAKAGAEVDINANLGKVAIDDVHWIRGAIDKEYRLLYDFALTTATITAQWKAAEALAKKQLRVVNTKSKFGAKFPKTRNEYIKTC